MKAFARAVILAGLGPMMIGQASAQAIPPGQSCGGLLCDMGVLGHKVAPGPDGAPPAPEQIAAAEAADPHHLPCRDFLCRAFGQKDVAAAPPADSAPVAAAPEPEKLTRKVKRKRVAKVEKAAAAPDAPETK